MTTNDNLEQTNIRAVQKIEDQRYKLSVILQDYRKSQKISQEELADKSGLTRQMVSRVETYSSAPTLITLLKYLNALGIDLVELIDTEIINKSQK